MEVIIFVLKIISYIVVFKMGKEYGNYKTLNNFIKVDENIAKEIINDEEIQKLIKDFEEANKNKKTRFK